VDKKKISIHYIDYYNFTTYSNYSNEYLKTFQTKRKVIRKSCLRQIIIFNLKFVLDTVLYSEKNCVWKKSFLNFIRVVLRVIL